MTGTVTIEELVAAHAAAINDPHALAACYAEESVSYDLAPPLAYTVSPADHAEFLRGWLQGFHGPVRVEVRDLQVHADGALALAHSLNALTATPQGGTEPFTLWYRATLVLQRTDGRLAIVHEHKSVPFHMDMQPYGFRAATDLEP